MEGAVSSPLPPLLFSPYINLDCPGRAPFQGQIPGQKEREGEGEMRGRCWLLLLQALPGAGTTLEDQSTHAQIGSDGLRLV